MALLKTRYTLVPWEIALEESLIRKGDFLSNISIPSRLKTEIESTFERILLVNDKFPRDPNNHTTQDPEHLIER